MAAVSVKRSIIAKACEQARHSFLESEEIRERTRLSLSRLRSRAVHTRLLTPPQNRVWSYVYDKRQT